MREFFKKIILNLTENSNIDFFAGRNIRMAPLNAPTLINLRAITRNYGVRLEFHQIFSVKLEIGDNAYRSVSGHFNITNVLKKYIQFKEEKQLAILKGQQQATKAELALSKLTEPDLQRSFNENFARAIESQRLNIMVLCTFFSIIQFIYKDKKIPGYYCNVQIPAGEPRTNDFEFFKEFLYPTNFLNTTNFCEKLSKKSVLNLQPIEIFHNFVKVQTFYLQIISPLGSIGFKLLFAAPAVGFINKIIFISYFQLKTKNPVLLVLTGLASYVITYSIIDTIINITCFCFQTIFSGITLVIRSISTNHTFHKLENPDKK